MKRRTPVTRPTSASCSIEGRSAQPLGARCRGFVRSRALSPMHLGRPSTLSSAGVKKPPPSRRLRRCARTRACRRSSRRAPRRTRSTRPRIGSSGPTLRRCGQARNSPGAMAHQTHQGARHANQFWKALFYQQVTQGEFPTLRMLTGPLSHDWLAAFQPPAATET